MAETLEWRHTWSRSFGGERRKAPSHYLYEQPLPDPTRLEDEGFDRAERQQEEGTQLARRPWDSGDDPDRFN